MEIPGIAPFGNQPTLTNPLSTSEQLAGREIPTRLDSEAVETVTANEQENTALATPQVVNEAGQTETGGFNPDNPGGTIDLTA